ncbi:50S ribosomal protein L3 N(5)-glutamine methyltransferase [Aliidiomarina halalkaliphila]|uniref:Ribosomal protein uL3 glutamine methyltransferase n=1 Tax=Aliidiomarina halalkaliphila TaxID=2593535 RepID=A0A552X3M1_9GAMM|nr:50S ribosomal protein L3 N(5)-glutamine methyltransferase [Aliidiomarina halalkaliphila]TRW49489.1 50S ribosomal protein L3 N(5)-glutamine methyltransferase [Aliidiomarina halalkaliphila]
MTHQVSQVTDDLLTIADWQRYIASALHGADVYFGHGAVDGWEEGLLLLSEVTALTFDELHAHRDCRLTFEEKSQLAALVARRIRDKVPAAYLVHKSWFAGLPFYVDERVLIPRSPIAELIEQEFQPWLMHTPDHILDLCTGSGCIAIACAYAFPDAIVDAVDISSDALAVARMNIEEHGLSDRVEAIESDGFNGLQDRRYDLIVTNPPYVDAEDMDDLPPEYHHEPKLGLSAGNDGLDLVRKILRDAPEHMNDGGILICEVGNSMVHMQALWPDVPFVWLSFERGGDGVFAINKEQLEQHAGHFADGA